VTTPDYYSDRTRGPRPRTEEEVEDALWAAVLALLERAIDNGALARDFPIRCEDGNGIYACDRDGVMATIAAEIPELDCPLSPHVVPPTLAVLDLLEFIQRYAYAVTDGPYHRFFDHHHLRFDRAEGFGEYRDTINRLLARSGTVYQLNEGGHMERLVPAAVAADLRYELPRTRDREFDKLLDTAKRKYLDPDPDTRQEALEKLWDAFERAKTMLHSDKKSGVAKLVAAATRETSREEAKLLDQEMKDLTDIGNQFRIRHHETKAILPSSAFVDQLFRRMYACLLRVHPALR
jgi:hypothetical protein